MAERSTLSDEDLIAILRKEENVAQNWQDQQLSSLRQSALDYYDRQPYGDEEEGQSAIVTSDFADTVEAVMPAMMRVFASGDDIAEFTPISQSDEEWARQATLYVPHVFMRENDGFRILYWLIKDALMYRMSSATVDVEEVEKATEEPVQGWTQEQMAAAEEVLREQGADEVEFDVEQDQAAPPPMQQPDAMPMDGMPMAAPAPTFSGTMTTTRRRKRVVIDNIAPEDLLVSPAEARDIDTASYVGYRKEVSASDLRTMGLSQDVIDSLSADRTSSPEEDQRQGGQPFSNDRKDDQRRLWLVVAYVKADDDGDGISEMLRCVYAHAGGVNGALIERMEWEEDEAPITIGSVILMSHSIVGRSLFDQTQDLQDIGTALTRGALDNVYFTNRPRPMVNARVNINSVLDYTPGMPVQVSGNDNPALSISWLQVPTIVEPALQALEYFAQKREERTGASRVGQALDANTLNAGRQHTATGMSLLMSSAQQRQELMARVLANTAISRLMRHVYRAIKRAATGPVKFYANGDWQEADPSQWPDDMHLIVAVGTGTGNKQQELQNLMLIGAGQEKLLALSQAAGLPLVTPEHAANTFRKLVEAAGFRASSQFVASAKDITAAQQQRALMPPQPQMTPELAKAHADAQTAAMKAQLDAQLAQQKALWDAQVKAWETQQKMQLEYHKAGIDAELKGIELQHETQLKALDIATRPRPNIPQQQVSQ